MQNLCLQPARGCHHTASAYLGTAAGRRAADQRQLRGGRQLAPPPARYQRAANVRHNRAGREGTPPSMRARQQRRGLREDRTGTRRAARGSAGSSAHTAAFPAPSSARRPVPARSPRGHGAGHGPGQRRATSVRPSVRGSAGKRRHRQPVGRAGPAAFTRSRGTAEPRARRTRRPRTGTLQGRRSLRVGRSSGTPRQAPRLHPDPALLSQHGRGATASDAPPPARSLPAAPFPAPHRRRGLRPPHPETRPSGALRLQPPRNKMAPAAPRLRLRGRAAEVGGAERHVGAAGRTSWEGRRAAGPPKRWGILVVIGASGDGTERGAAEEDALCATIPRTEPADRGPTPAPVVRHLGKVARRYSGGHFEAITWFGVAAMLGRSQRPNAAILGSSPSDVASPVTSQPAT